MRLRWLKPYLPRGLFGRTVLILLLPVVTLMLVVSIVFVERYYKDVSQQMVLTAAREIRLVLREPAGSPMAEALGITRQRVTRAALPPTDRRGWFDLSGAFVIEELRKRFDNLARISLVDPGRVRLYFQGEEAFTELVFDRRRLSARRPYKLFWNMLFFGTLMTLASYLYLRAQVRPISRLARAANAFGRGRTIAYRPSGATEVRAAGQAFLAMRARIERQIEQRTLMLSGISHDLRTPLTRLKLNLSMLDEAERKPMEADIAEMERLIDAFLDFVRGTHEADPAPEPLDPTALVRRIVEAAQRVGLPVTLARAEGAGKMALREAGMKRAVENLINNAVRYGTRAEVSVHLTGSELRVRVEDDGPGIPEDSRDEALKPFVRLDSARNQNRGSGVGLGLSIAVDVVRGHGGTLRLGQSRRLGGLCAEIVIGRDAQAAPH